ncbi:hypothetical protein Q0M94_02860 [Deinococcus radiomollis]|uniref:hypothetical protein n=1 Tax=Deinococcus radiomollis TaxID=468916 RepID=UPI0038923DDC
MEPRLLPNAPVEFAGVLSLPRREQAPEGQLYQFRFDNGYGALVMYNVRQPPAEAFEVCLMDCTREPARPTFEHLICPEVLFGLSKEQVSALLAKAERLPRHPRLTNIDEALLGEDF